MALSKHAYCLSMAKTAKQDYNQDCNPAQQISRGLEQLVDGSRWNAPKLRALLEIMGAEALPEFVDAGIDECDDPA